MVLPLMQVLKIRRLSLSGSRPAWLHLEWRELFFWYCRYYDWGILFCLHVIKPDDSNSLSGKFPGSSLGLFCFGIFFFTVHLQRWFLNYYYVGPMCAQTFGFLYTSLQLFAPYSCGSRRSVCLRLWLLRGLNLTLSGSKLLMSTI